MTRLQLSVATGDFENAFAVATLDENDATKLIGLCEWFDRLEVHGLPIAKEKIASVDLHVMTGVVEWYTDDTNADFGPDSEIDEEWFFAEVGRRHHDGCEPLEIVDDAEFADLLVDGNMRIVGVLLSLSRDSDGQPEVSWHGRHKHDDTHYETIAIPIAKLREIAAS